MKMKKGNRVHHSSQKMVNGSSQEIADMMLEKKLLEPGDHNLLIYNDLRAFREIYSQYSRALLPENEIVVIGSQYDALKGYQDVDSHGLWKLAMSLLSRVKKEGRQGVTWFGDLGSFFSFEKIEELMQYELWCAQKYEEKMKTVCCYHLKDFDKLNETQLYTLVDYHFKSILVE